MHNLVVDRGAKHILEPLTPLLARNPLKARFRTRIVHHLHGGNFQTQVETPSTASRPKPSDVWTSFRCVRIFSSSFRLMTIISTNSVALLAAVFPTSPLFSSAVRMSQRPPAALIACTYLEQLNTCCRNDSMRVA